jgi:hypothetical protein
MAEKEIRKAAKTAEAKKADGERRQGRRRGRGAGKDRWEEGAPHPLIESAWYFTALDDATEATLFAIVRKVGS